MEKQTTPAVSTEAILDTIRLLRDSRITAILKTDAALHQFMKKHYGTSDLTEVKKEFLKRDLRVLRTTTLDLEHYQSLVREVKEFGGTGLASNQLFLQELDVIFKKYGF